jgi:hypothetical protein
MPLSYMEKCYSVCLPPQQISSLPWEPNVFAGNSSSDISRIGNIFVEGNTGTRMVIGRLRTGAFVSLRATKGSPTRGSLCAMENLAETWQPLVNASSNGLEGSGPINLESMSICATLIFPLAG